MPSQNKKRFNAFDDLAQDAAGSLSGIGSTPLTPSLSPIAAVERIERLAPSQMLPDRFQPRRLLPPSIRQDFFSGKIDCYQAAASWLDMTRSDPAIKVEVERLVAMGESFDEHGQIKPITGAWKEGPNGNYIFLIETGERRFWAACLKRVKNRAAEESLLRVEVVDNPTRQRQVLENRHAEPPSAVEQACEISALILTELGMPAEESVEDEYDYFRKVRSQRMPTGLWEKITPVMQLTRPRMVQLLNILQLPSPLLDLADRYRLSERVLREILSAPSQQRERLIQVSIQSQLTSDEVSAVSTSPEPPPHSPGKPPSSPRDPGREASRSLLKFIRSINRLDPVDQSQTLDLLADEIVFLGQAQETLTRLEELSRLIEARLKHS
ncbi:MAG: hypothetical protein HGA28_01970 [Anaerolineaceae bacterium]|nr:hypothetical protein [Anaerolineaceae bacterium]